MKIAIAIPMIAPMLGSPGAVSEPALPEIETLVFYISAAPYPLLKRTDSG